MDDFLITKGWHYAGACGCTPKKFTYKNNTYPDHKFKIVPTRQMWYLYQYDRLIANGQQSSLPSQYNAIFN